MISVGGHVVIEGEITQDVVVILGTLKLSGSVGGSVTGVLSNQELSRAQIDRELINVLGPMEIERTTVRRE